MKLINIGFGNMVSANRLVAIVSPESAPIKAYHSGCQGARFFDRRDLWPPYPCGDRHGQRSRDSFCGAARRRLPTV